MEIAGLVLGILGIVFGFIIIGIIPSILGIVFSTLSLKRKRNGMATAGLVCSIVGVCISVLVIAISASSPTSGTVSSSVIVDSQNTDTVETYADMVECELFSYSDMGDTFAFVVVTNNNDVAVDVDTSITAYDGSGNIIGAYTNNEYCIAPGHSFPIWHYVEGEENVASFDYDVTVTKSSRTSAIDDEVDLSIENLNDNGVIVTVTNNHDYDIEYLNAYALFFDGDEFVGFGETYIENVSSDTILQAGKTVTDEIDINSSDVAFDSARVYLHATK